MADETETETVPDSKKKLVKPGIAVAALAVGYYMFLGPGAGAPAEPLDTPEVQLAPAEGEIVEVGSMTVNLNGDQLRYARLGFALVLEEGAVSADVESRLALMRDAALSEVSQWEPDDLRTSAGHQLLRDGLTQRAMEVWPEGEVIRVVLTELIVQ